MIWTEYEAGERNARDNIIAMIVGMQNEIGHHNPENPRYATLQEVLLCIADRYGEMMTPYKG